MQPVDFSKLDKDDEGAIMLAVCVAMLWGWLPAKQDCPDCGGSMKLMDKHRYNDKLAWVCCDDGIQVKRKHSKKQRCQTEFSVRHGTWMEATNAQLGRILQAIYCWCLGLTGKQIQKCSNLKELAVSKITKACHLIAENFMLQNPELNKDGGLNKYGHAASMDY